MQEIKTFPFGQPIVSLAQSDRSPKRVFILGVYASAVHARWVGEDGRSIVKALAVASEPEMAKLGSHSAKWADLHESWVKNVAPSLL